VAHADVRGAKKYNEKLTERRAECLKGYLVSRGVATDKITTRADGKEHQQDMKKVEMLLAKSPNKPEKWMMRDKKTTWLAYNRRVDIVLEPKGQESVETYPDDAADARILWARKEPSLKSVEKAAKTTVSVAQARTTVSK
jgi:hypothetical protein